MLTILKGLFQIFDDATKRVPLYNTGDDKLLQIVVDGYQEYNAGKARMERTTPAFTLPRGTVANVRAWYLRVEGAAGINVTITTTAVGAPTIERHIRPLDSSEDASTTEPAGIMLETADDVASIVIQHPTPADATAVPVMVHYCLVGDAAA